MDRRTFVKGAILGSGAAIGIGTGTLIRNHLRKELSVGSLPVLPKDYRLRTVDAEVAVLPAESYKVDLVGLMKGPIEHFLRKSVIGSRCVVKPNMVEFISGAPVNTHPAVLSAVSEVLRNLGAKSVVIAEGTGHRRDNEYMLRHSGYLDVIDSHNMDYVDLNLDDPQSRPIPRNYTKLDILYLPKTILEADIVVSLAKMKLHKHVGATLSMKNLFGCAPGAVYGWPKNKLHFAGVSESIVDLTDVIRPQLCIIDGIVGMEGYAPIQGTAKQHGVIVIGNKPASVDATACRLMGVDPFLINYIVAASFEHGSVLEDKITMIGENWRALKKDYQLTTMWKHIRLGAKTKT